MQHSEKGIFLKQDGPSGRGCLHDKITRKTCEHQKKQLAVSQLLLIFARKRCKLYSIDSADPLFLKSLQILPPQA